MKINHPSGVKGRDERTFIDPNIFRTYDIRGVYPADLNEEIAYRIAKSYAFLYPESRKIILARDPRSSSSPLAGKIIEAN